MGRQEIGQESRKLEKSPLGSRTKQAESGPKYQTFREKADFLAQLDQFDSIVVAYEESAKREKPLRSYKQSLVLKKEPKLLFIFGPEGGLSPAEIESFEAKGAVLAGLGPRILRAETARFTPYQPLVF